LNQKWFKKYKDDLGVLSPDPLAWLPEDSSLRTLLEATPLTMFEQIDKLYLDKLHVQLNKASVKALSFA
jgi:hypothetical protein